jgi:transcriptional regulator with XRE-family HTH domain
MADMKDFAQWLRDRVVAAGYDLSSPRAGGRTKLAQDADIALSQVQRALGGTTRPDIVTLRAIGRVLDIPMTTLLVRSGTIAPEDLEGGAKSASELDVRALGLQRGVPAEQLDRWLSVVDAVTNAFAEEQSAGQPRSSTGE